MSNMNEATNDLINFPIIDSHIHLYSEAHLEDLAWAPSLPDGHVLKQQNSVEQYQHATKLQPNLLGFVFVETDRKSSILENGWTNAFEEIEFLRRVKSGSPREGEGHVPEDGRLLLGVVAWVPLGAPLALLKKYLEQSGALQDFKENGLVKGVRYLLQDKPPGTALRQDFIEGLLLLEAHHCKTFDLGVDFRQGGHWQLLEAIEMLEQFYVRSTGRLKIVINHFCKPNLRLTKQDVISKHPDFENWRSCIKRLSEFPSTFMKLSGFFSELPSQDPDNATSTTALLEYTWPYILEVFRHFGPNTDSAMIRVMFGSDWPVCNVGGPGSEKSWKLWVQFTNLVLEVMDLSSDSKAQVWAGCAKNAYGLHVEESGRT